MGFLVQRHLLTCLCLIQSYLLMATVIFLPYVSKACSWCKGRLVGRCAGRLVCGASALLPKACGAWEGPRRP